MLSDFEEWYKSGSSFITPRAKKPSKSSLSICSFGNLFNVFISKIDNKSNKFKKMI